MRDIVLTVIVMGILPMILKRPYLGIYTWCWFAYMNPHRLTWGFAYDFPFSMLIALFTLVGLLLSKEAKSFPRASVTAIQLVFVLWMTFTTFFSLVSEPAWTEWNRMIKIQLMVFVSMVLINNRERLHWLVWIIVLSHAFYSVKGGIFVLLTGGQSLVYGPADSFIADNNALALAIVMILPLMWFFSMQVTKPWQKWAIWIMVALSCFSILSSYSRGAFLAVCCMGLFLMLKSRKKAVLWTILIVLIPVLISFMPSQWFDRMETIETYKEDASAMGRINAWAFAFNLAKDHFLGGGFNAFTPSLFLKYAPDPTDVHDAHSIYFEVLGEHGFIGLFIFLLLGVMSLMLCRGVVKKAQRVSELSWAVDLVSMVQVSLIGYAVGGTFLGLAYYDLYYQLIAIAVIVNFLVDECLAGESDNLESYTQKRSFVRKNPQSKFS